MNDEELSIADSTEMALISARDLLHQELQAQENNSKLAELHQVIDEAIESASVYDTSDLDELP